MGRNSFGFAGGEELTTMGACWFVSYCYYEKIDCTHTNWNLVSTKNNRISVYKRTVNYHRHYLEEILNMNSVNLEKNTLNLNATEVKNMAKEILDTMLDWNGNGKIDPVDIGVSISTENETKEETTQTNNKKANAGCLTSIILTVTVIAAIVSIILI